MTTRQAMFYEIAEAYGTPEEERTERQIRITFKGLCSAAWVCGVEWNQSCKVRRIRGEYPVYWFPCSYHVDWLPIYDTYRCQLALFMAVMSDEDFNLLLKEVE